MEHGMYAVYDSKAKAFIPPFVMSNDDVAIRVFAGCANDASHNFCKFAVDFTLFKLGIFDDSTGAIRLFEHHENLGLASQYKELPL